MDWRKNRNERGFSLLEVLIAIVILSIGLLAIAALQGRLLRTTADTKARTAALQLADGQVDRFRDIDQIATGAGIPDFEDIVDGSLADNGQFDWNGAANTVTQGGVEYTVSWDVTDHWWDDASGAFTETSPGAGITPDFKLVEVTVAWTDESNETQNVVVEEIIAQIAPTDSGQVLNDGLGGDASPKVSYTPGNAPEVVKVPTDLAGGIFKETDKPEPEILKNDFSTITTFTTVLFEEVQEGVFEAGRREEFFVVNCACEYTTANTTIGLGRTPTVWNGDAYVEGVEVTGKQIGTVDPDITGQPVLCTSCCRDHHDITGVDDVYDPFRPVDNESDGNHKHYKNDLGSLIKAQPNGATAADRKYDEVCRFIRTDGILRTAQDFQMEAYNIMPSIQLQTESGLSGYQTYIADFVEDYINAVEGLGASYPEIRPDSDGLDATFTPVNITSSDLPQQHLARGIYIDFMDDELLECIDIRRGNVDPVDDTPVYCLPSAGGYLEIVPFFEVNVTQFTDWSAAGGVSVTADSFSLVDNSGFSRGLVSLVDNSQEGTVLGTMNRSNSGLTASESIDPDDADEPTDLDTDYEPADDTSYPNGDGTTADNGYQTVASKSTVTSGSNTSVVTLQGNVGVAQQAKALQPSGVAISTTTTGVVCTKPTDSTLRCQIQTSALTPGFQFNVKFSSYVLEFQQGNSVSIDDLRLCTSPTSPVTIVSSTVNNPGTTSENTVLVIGGITDSNTGSSPFTLNVNFKPQNQNC